MNVSFFLIVKQKLGGKVYRYFIIVLGMLEHSKTFFMGYVTNSKCSIYQVNIILLDVIEL